MSTNTSFVLDGPDTFSLPHVHTEFKVGLSRSARDRERASQTWLPLIQLQTRALRSTQRSNAPNGHAQ